MKTIGKMAFFALFSIATFILLVSCDQMDTLVLPGAARHQYVQAFVNNAPISENAFLGSGCEIILRFADFDLDDPEITGLAVFLRGPQGEVPGSRSLFALERSPRAAAQENAILVSRFDRDIPPFQPPQGLEAGIYTLVSQVMAGSRIMLQNEHTFYYLASAEFAFQDIQMFLPNAVATSRIVPGGTTVLLEARAAFDNSLSPRIVWRNGRTVISEGNLADGAGRLLWTLPEVNSFISLSAEIFPITAQQGFSGITREISLPVSTRITEPRVISADSPGLARWFLFAGDLADSRDPASEQARLVPQIGGRPVWLPVAGGSYGLAAGPHDTFSFGGLSLEEAGQGGGRFLFRFIPLADGGIFSAFFDTQGEGQIEMNLSLENESLILSLQSPYETVFLSAPAADLAPPLITGMIDFTTRGGRIEASLELAEDFRLPTSPSPLARQTVGLNAHAAGGFKVSLGEPFGGQVFPTAVFYEGSFTAIWDEFAFFYN